MASHLRSEVERRACPTNVIGIVDNVIRIQNYLRCEIAQRDVQYRPGRSSFRKTGDIRLRCRRRQRDKRTLAQQIIHIDRESDGKPKLRFAFLCELLTTLPVKVVNRQLR
jgi:hypothetical protein